MAVSIFQVDSFSAEPFKGNPAAVCLLEGPRPAEWMQRVAAEMNLSETAFVVPKGSAFGLRWFTPTTEVPLCGHATLASAHILWETSRLKRNEDARFDTMSGRLMAKLRQDGIEMDFPLIQQRGADPPSEAVRALGIAPKYCGKTVERGHGDVDFLFEVDSEEVVRGLKPDFGLLGSQVEAGVIVTAKSDSPSCDFVSRYFASWWGIDEDPVTGAAHCSLVPFWCERLGKLEVLGYQASARGGYVRGRVSGDRVALLGQAVTVLRGELEA